MTFAIITVAILAGSIAERIKFSSFMVFTAFGYYWCMQPICHWVWGGGWLMADGALDFAGGTVVHINAGVAGIVLAAVLGKRNGYNRDPMAPSNLALTFNWYGFDLGRLVLASMAVVRWRQNALAGNALLVTQVAAAAGH